MRNSLTKLNQTIIECRKCPRLVRWREACAARPPRRYFGQSYWAKPLAGFGDPSARLLIIGLAPAAHGGNRTGRMFTGDRSGDWLYGALHEAGFASQPDSQHRDDGLELYDCYVTAAVHCAPPLNKPSRREFDRCRDFLIEELQFMRTQIAVVLVLGRIAFDAYLKAVEASGAPIPKPRPKFAHGLSVRMPAGPLLICSYHPGQQNTFTGKLNRAMFRAVFQQARAALAG